jgi:hypothetical protein
MYFFIYLDYKKKYIQNGLGFACPAFISYMSCLTIQHMDLLSLVLCSIFVQSLDFELELTSFDTFRMSLLTSQSYPLVGTSHNAKQTTPTV